MLTIQHLVNVMCAILLGPWYGLAAAFLAALIRNILGLGTLLAFPGSMCGALLSSLLYKWIKKLPAAYVGEVDRHRYHWRRAGLSDCGSADGQSDSGTFYICCTIFD